MFGEIEMPNFVEFRLGDLASWENLGEFVTEYEGEDFSAEEEYPLQEEHGYDAEYVAAWVKSWGTKNELRRPKRRTLGKLLAEMRSVARGEPKDTSRSITNKDRYPSKEALEEMVERGRTSDKTVGIDGDELEAWFDGDDPNAPMPLPKKIVPNAKKRRRKKSGDG